MQILKIGKLSSNDIELKNDLTVSKVHCEIFVDNEGNVFLSDLNSSNGTFVNGTKITEPVQLNKLDIVRAGNSLVNWQTYIKIQNKEEEIDKFEELKNPVKSNSELFSNAWKNLGGQWGISIGFVLVAYIFIFISGAIYVSLIIGGALAVGQAIFWLNVSRNNNPEISDLFEGFNSFVSSLGAWWLKALIFLCGTILLIIPGIYWAYCYSMTWFVMADNTDIGAMEAMKRSKKIMNGYKWKLFRFNLRAFLLFLLGVIPLGLGLFVVGPWMSVAFAKFYEDIKDR